MTPRTANRATSRIIAANVRAEIARRGDVSTATIERTLFLSRSAYNRRIRGYVPFSTDELHRLASLLGIPVSALFAGTEPTAPTEQVQAAS